MRKFFVSILLFLSSTSYAGGIPNWAKNRTQSLSGNIYKAVCSGQGPSIDIARNEALQSCKASATGQLQRDGKVKSLSIESESDVSFYQEVSESVSFKGLICVPERESTQAGEDGSFRIWVLCRFDLSKVEIGEDLESRKERISEDSPTPNLSKLKEKTFAVDSESITSQEHTVINVAVVPNCTKILIRGARPRAKPCLATPVSISIQDSDQEAIITAAGYISKTLPLKGRRWRNNETIQVILDQK